MKKLFLLFIVCLLFLCSCDLALDDFSSSSEPTTHDLTLTYEASEGGVIVGETTQSVHIDIGAEHTFTQVIAQPNEGYYFVNWSDGSTEPVRTDTISESKKLSALFLPNGVVKIEYLPSEGGTISGETIQYLWLNTLGTQVSAVPNDGYVFLGWSDNITRQNRTDVATTSISVTAIFKSGYWADFICDPNEGKIIGNAHQAIEKGQKTTFVTASAKPGYRFIKWSNGETNPAIQITVEGTTSVTAIFERLDLELPVISIVTQDERLPLEHKYMDCSISVENTKDEYALNKVACEIRERGNTSAQIDKRSYKIKLDKAFDLFGNGTYREWTLISNHFDLSLIRNYLAFKVASGFDKLDSSSSVQFVDLYINGDYRGVYLVCDQIEAGAGRVDVDKDLSSTDTGYLIELDDRLDGTGFYVNGQFYGIKDPDTEAYNFTPEHTEFIKNYIEQCITAMHGNDWAQIEALIDTESFAQAYLVFELFHCEDVGFSSFFMHKDAGGKLMCGPVWDFDRSVGNVGKNYSSRNPENLYAKQKNSWFYSLLQHEEFKSLVAKTLDENKDMIRNTLNQSYADVESCKNAFDRNFKRWNLLGQYFYPSPSEIYNLRTWQEQVNYNKTWLERSLSYLVTQYPAN